MVAQKKTWFKQTQTLFPTKACTCFVINLLTDASALAAGVSKQGLKVRIPVLGWWWVSALSFHL